MKLTFLGTSCMVPTKERNHAGIFLRYHGEGILIDCGEGTQRQLKMAGIKITDTTRLIITHWHGDHVLGIPGLLQSLGASEYSGKLIIYGPKGTKKFMDNMLKAFVFDRKVEFEVIEITKDGRFMDQKKFFMEAYFLEHGITTLGYKFIEKDRRRINLQFVRKLGIPDGPLLGKLQQGHDITFKGKKVLAKDATIIVKGKKIGFISDTILCKGCYDIAQDCDTLVSEAAYESSHEDKARQYKHMTAKQAAQIASQSDAEKLYLTHFSARYKTTDDLKKGARAVFKDTVCAYDLMNVKIS